MATTATYYSINNYLSDGVQSVYEISFAGGYLSRDHVKAFYRYGDIRQELGLVWINDFTVQTVPTAPSGSTLVIYRDTPKDRPIADFSDGAVVTEANLDINAMQAVFIAAEAWDRANGGLIADIGDEYALRLSYPIGRISGDALSNAMKVIGLDADGQPTLFNRDATDLTDVIARLLALEEGSKVTPYSAAAVGGSFGAMANLARKIRSAAFRGSNVTIKFAGVGSSNMKNESGGLAGVGNSPVEIAMRAAKKWLDPMGFCTWEFQNFGVNGSAFSGYSAPGLDDTPGQTPQTPSPRARVEAYKPDVIIVCYGTNDAATASWNSGQTRDYIPIGVQDIADHGAKLGSDVVFMTVPSAHVAKSLPIYIPQSIGVVYPNPSFQVGLGDAAFHRFAAGTGSANRFTTDVPGTFTNAANGFGLAVGKVIAFTDPYFGNTVPNAGMYRISAVAANGNWIEVDRKMRLNDQNVLVDDGPAALTFDGYKRAAVQRVGIDINTELVPNNANSYEDIDVLGDGRTVRVLTRFFDLNQVMRTSVASLDVPATLADVEAQYHVELLKPGITEDRFHDVDEIVHWNANFALEVIMPVFDGMFRALASVVRTLSNSGAKPYSRKLLVRPQSQAYDSVSQYDPNGTRRKLDLMLATGENMVIRSPDGRIRMEFVWENQTVNLVRRIQDANGGYRTYKKLTSTNYNIGEVVDDIRVTMPGPGYVTGEVRGAHGSVGNTLYKLTGMWDGTTWRLTTEKLHTMNNPLGGDTLTFSTSGNQIIITPTTGGSEVDYDLDFKSIGTTPLATPDA